MPDSFEAEREKKLRYLRGTRKKGQSGWLGKGGGGETFEKESKEVRVPSGSRAATLLFTIQEGMSGKERPEVKKDERARESKQEMGKGS